MLDEMGHPAIPLSVISKAAEIQLLYAVDKVLLGNRWLRKVTGIQPKFPYLVDSFERRYSHTFFFPSLICVPHALYSIFISNSLNPNIFMTNEFDGNGFMNPCAPALAQNWLPAL